MCVYILVFKSMITEMRNSLKMFRRTSEVAEERISKLEDKSIWSIQYEQQKENERRKMYRASEKYGMPSNIPTKS